MKLRRPNTTSFKRLSRRQELTIAALTGLFLAVCAIFIYWWWTRPPKPFVQVVTLAVAGPRAKPVKSHHEPFGVIADDDGNLFVSESVTGRIYRIPIDGYSSKSTAQNETIVAEGLETPSAQAFDVNGGLIVANTGAHTIVRIDLEKKTTTVIAGANGESGNADGAPAEARFNGPIGVAIGKKDVIFVADTYNDRIRVISSDGKVSALAGGGGPGFADGNGGAARFNTPCGIAVANDGSLLIADTGNHRIRRVTLDGQVTTIAGTGEATERDGLPFDAAFEEPTAIAIRDKNSFYIADAASSAIRLVSLGEQPSVTTLVGEWPNGLVDGELNIARLNRPTGLAVLPDGELVFADSGSGLIRAFVPKDSEIGRRIDPGSVIIQALELKALLEPRWPFDPPQAKRDIAGTFGEVRGERLPDHDVWFHNGLDVPGEYGEQVRAIYSERVTRPLAVTDAGGTRERLRLPLFEYIHVRIGRDQNDRPLPNFPDGAIAFFRDELGQITDLRIRRGTRINAGDPIGTLNRLNHVHLTPGPPAFEFNALTTLKLPGLIDTISPRIEAVKILDEHNNLIADSIKDAKRIAVKGKLQIVVRAYDQVDGNPGYRKLGVYRLGYQVLNEGEPVYNIVFDRLPSIPNGPLLAYAEGSQSGYQGVTIFDYLVTNIVKGGEAREEFFDTSKLAPGDYTLRVLAEDYFGNQAKRDLKLTISK